MSPRMFACWLCLLASLPVAAAEPEKSAKPSAASKSEAAEQTDRAVRRAIRQLDSDTFAERREAAELLRDAGAAAIAPLVEACRDGAGERIAQSIEILKSFAASEDREVSSAALTALQKIADANNATAAKLASSAVDSTRTIPGRPPSPRLGDANGMRGDDPFVNPFGSLRGPNIGMSKQRINGHEKITINDGDRRVEINKDPNGAIRVEWQDGDEAAHIASAEDLDTLRTAHPEAIKVYDQYQIWIAAGPGVDGPGPGLFAPMRLDGLAIPQPMRQIDEQWARMRADHQRLIDDMRAQHALRVQNMRQIAPPRRAEPPAQLRQLREDAQRLQQRVQNGEVDEATREEIARLHELLQALQQPTNP